MNSSPQQYHLIPHFSSSPLLISPLNLSHKKKLVNQQTYKLYNWVLTPYCRGGRTRTDDLLVPNQAYYQLYYTPKKKH